jgi:hypothetical protein
MKHTKSMIYQPTAESEELYIFANNEIKLYPQIEAIENNLRKKINKGIYETEKAVDAFYYAMTAASDLYKKYFGYAFTVTERYTAATEMANNFTYENM